MPHPNTVAGISAGSLGLVVIYVLSLLGVEIPGWLGDIIATALVGFFLFLGRGGLVGLKNFILHGHTSTP